MSEKDNNNDTTELEISKKHFEKLLKICLIIGIITVSGFIIYYILNPEPGYADFGILNSNKKAENYPTSANVSENIYFYVTVGNYLNREFTFEVKILKGDNETELSDSPTKDANLNFTTDEVTLAHNEEWISDKLTISFFQVGEDQKIIVELWEITKDNEEEFNNILWLRLNITT